MASSTLTDAAPVPVDVDLDACVRALEDARAAVVRLTVLVDRETATTTATALDKLLTTIELATEECANSDGDVDKVAPALWVALVHAWLSVPPNTATSLHLMDIAHRLACAAFGDGAGAPAPTVDAAAVTLLHKVLSADFKEPWRQMMQRLLSERVFCALTCFRDVSLGVLARGMTLDAALSVLMRALGSCLTPLKGRTFAEAVRALESAEGADAQLDMESQLQLSDILGCLQSVVSHRVMVRSREPMARLGPRSERTSLPQHRAPATSL